MPPTVYYRALCVSSLGSLPREHFSPGLIP
jgi:hypothetical protein